MHRLHVTRTQIDRLVAPAQHLLRVGIHDIQNDALDGHVCAERDDALIAKRDVKRTRLMLIETGCMRATYQDPDAGAADPDETASDDKVATRDLPTTELARAIALVRVEPLPPLPCAVGDGACPSEEVAAVVNAGTAAAVPECEVEGKGAAATSSLKPSALTSGKCRNLKGSGLYSADSQRGETVIDNLAREVEIV